MQLGPLFGDREWVCTEDETVDHETLRYNVLEVMVFLEILLRIFPKGLGLTLSGNAINDLVAVSMCTVHQECIDIAIRLQCINTQLGGRFRQESKDEENNDDESNIVEP